MFGHGQEDGHRPARRVVRLIASEKYKMDTFDEDWYLGDTFNSAIGQGFQLVTPLQAAMIVSEVANGGIQYRPFLVSRIDNLDGTPYKIFAPEQIGTLSISRSTLDLIREGMRNVTEEGTAGYIFADFPIQVAGKTGTAENYSGQDHGWFVAYAPFDHPRIVIAVLVEQAGMVLARLRRLLKKCWKNFSTSQIRRRHAEGRREGPEGRRRRSGGPGRRAGRIGFVNSYCTERSRSHVNHHSYRLG